MDKMEEEASAEDDFFSAAFEAVKADDVDGFKDAMRGAIQACMASYGPEEEE